MSASFKIPLKVICYLLPLFHLFTDVHAQISGTVTDQTTNRSVAGASVFINNSTYGCKADKDGHFELKSFPPPPFQLIISSVGYTTSTHNIKELPASDISILLQPKVQDLKEVVILSPEKDGWAKYGTAFIKDFIGYSAFAQECVILNKEVLEFRYDQADNKLMVSTQKPLKIKNKATGYLITYWLEDYEKDYSTHKLFFKGYTQFEGLPSDKNKVKERWKNNRQSAYQGSLQHFMRSVYNNTVYQDSFEVRVAKRVKEKEYGMFVPLKTDTLTNLSDSFISYLVTRFLNFDNNDIPIWSTLITKWSGDKDAVMPVIINGKQQDSLITKKLIFKKNPQKHTEMWIQYYDINNKPMDSMAVKMAKAGIHIFANDSAKALPQKTNKLYLVVWKEKMSIDSFITRNPSGAGVVMKFKDLLQVTYLKEKEELPYLKNQHPPSKYPPANQTSMISIRNPIGIIILPDGNFYDPYNLLLEDYWSYEKMDKMLPLDYVQ